MNGTITISSKLNNQGLSILLRADYDNLRSFDLVMSHIGKKRIKGME